MLREAWERLSRVDAGSSTALLVVVVATMSFVTVVAVLMATLASNFLPLAIAGLGWASFLLFVAIYAAVLEPGSRKLVPRGSSTPYVRQHSRTQALVATGAYREAAEAYRAAIAADPDDLLACDQLVRLALGELKDGELALYAAREGEKRAPDPRRRVGFALLVATIYRDTLKDYGRAMVELRRVLATYPDVPGAARLKAEIEELKAMHFEAR